MILEASNKGLISGGQLVRKLKENPEIIKSLSDYNRAVRQIPRMDVRIRSITAEEQMPTVHWKVPVAIAFLEDVSIEAQRRRQQVEVARRMRAAREAMSPLGVSVKDVVEEGRER